MPNELTVQIKTADIKDRAGWIFLHTRKENTLKLRAYLYIKSRDGSVVIALGYGLYDWGSRVRFPPGAGNFSPHHRVQNGSGAHPVSYPMGTRGSFPGGKAVGA
jgi:hypothetical protein